MPSGCPVERRVRIGICRWKVLTNNVDLACKRPGFATAERPVGGPDTAAMGHGVNVGDEETGRPGVLGGDADGLAEAIAYGGALVDGDDGGTVVLNVSELAGVGATDKLDETVGGVRVGVEVPVTARRRDSFLDD